MKHIVLTVALLMSFLSCKAQSPIVPIDSYEYSENIYYKDIDCKLIQKPNRLK
ncbi:hypothetical protein [Winogradskyella luteola]|uniref:Uncharacterized protein n=1 Tax=Winogradskyella luteola TaxID=2828330 RepID=A0A9X1F5V2_9FLAO|nr:hypothetical protein [Winogradskyella luteola]MBV7267945.1 hypothetical protein [Winogradskyella luteola]